LKICKIVVAFLVLAPWGVSAYSQSTPLTAKIHQTEQVFVNGQLVQSHTREGIFLRTSTGMVLREWTIIDGKPSGGEAGYGSLTDTQKGLTYSVDYTRKVAYQHPSIPIPQSGKPQNLTQNPATNAREKASVEGLSCTYNPAYIHPKPGETVYGGRICRSEEYNVNLRQELTLPAPENPTQYSKVSEELTEIHIGEEPDPKLFDLQSFTIYRPDQKKN
jgi:hypothetical protein